MKRLNPLLLLPILFAAFAAPAVAQANIVVMNETQIMRDSAVGRHIAERMRAIGTEVDAELAAVYGPIEQEQQALEAETANMTQEGVAARPDLVQRFQALRANAQQFDLMRQLRQRELLETQATATQPVREALAEVLQELVDSRSIDIVIDRSNLVFASSAVDITPDIIAALDERLPSVAVNRVRLPQPTAAPAGEQ